MVCLRSTDFHTGWPSVNKLNWLMMLWVLSYNIDLLFRMHILQSRDSRSNCLAMIDGACAHRLTIIAVFLAHATITRNASGWCYSLQANLESDMQFMGVVSDHMCTAQTALFRFWFVFVFFWSVKAFREWKPSAFLLMRRTAKHTSELNDKRCSAGGIFSQFMLLSLS